MYANQWRLLGYVVSFQHLELPEQEAQDCVCLFHKELKTCFCTPVKARWWRNDDLNQPPWFALHHVPEFRDSQLCKQLEHIAASCYCSPAATCVFCAGVS